MKVQGVVEEWNSSGDKLEQLANKVAALLSKRKLSGHQNCEENAHTIEYLAEVM